MFKKPATNDDAAVASTTEDLQPRSARNEVREMLPDLLYWEIGNKIAEEFLDRVLPDLARAAVPFQGDRRGEHLLRPRDAEAVIKKTLASMSLDKREKRRAEEERLGRARRLAEETRNTI